MDRKVVDPLLVNPNSLEENKRVGVVDADEAIGVGGDEVSREGEVRRCVEGEGRNGGGVVGEGAEGRGRGEIVDVDGVVGAAGGCGGA